jgi:hypothetical protein
MCPPRLHELHDYQTYHLTLAETEALEEALRGTQRFPNRGKTLAEQQEFVDTIWRRIAGRCRCDFDTIMPTSPPSPTAFRAVPLPPIAKMG